MPPFAGQGLNSGLRDAANLAWKLAAVTSGRCGPALLESYEAERRGHVEKMTRLAAFLGRAIMPTTPWRAAARDIVFQTLWAMPWWRRLTRSRALLPSPTLGKTALARGAALPKDGPMIPQPTLRRADGSDVLLDDHIGSGFAALGLGCAPEDAAAGLRRWCRKGRAIAILRPDRFAAMLFTPSPAAPQLGWMKAANDLR